VNLHGEDEGILYLVFAPEREEDLPVEVPVYPLLTEEEGVVLVRRLIQTLYADKSVKVLDASFEPIQDVNQAVAELAVALDYMLARHHAEEM
jgi:hypothetical protein